MQLPTWTPLGARLESHLSGKRPWGLVDKLVRKVERADEPLSRDELQAAMGAVPVGALVDLLIRRRVLVERVEARRLVLISRRRQ